MKDLAAAYSSRVCEYCNCYKSSILPIELFYSRGRKKRWVTSCHDCAGQPAARKEGIEEVYLATLTGEEHPKW